MSGDDNVFKTRGVGMAEAYRRFLLAISLPSASNFYKEGSSQTPRNRDVNPASQSFHLQGRNKFSVFIVRQSYLFPFGLCSGCLTGLPIEHVIRKLGTG